MELIKNNGDTLILKVDGERKNNFFTVVIAFPNQDHESLRLDHADLEIAVSIIVDRYSKIKPIDFSLIS